MNESQILVGRIAWSYNGWKGFDRKGYLKRSNYNFKYINVFGFGYEWWNFYEGFSDEYYFGNTYRSGPHEFTGLTIFISKNIDDNRFYLVGFYGKCVCGRFSVNVLVKELLPSDVLDEIRSKFDSNKISNEKFNSEIHDIFSGKKYEARFRAKKELSTSFVKRGYIEVTPDDIGVGKIGQWPYTYARRNEDKLKILKLLQKAKEKHQDLLNSAASESEKEEIREIIHKIDLVIDVYFSDIEASNSDGEVVVMWLEQDVSSILNNKKQAILYGPPGTGKTWLARKYVSGYADSKHCEFVTFHPSYSYEEFVEGLRPVPADGGLNFVIEDGIFKRLVIRALCEALMQAEDSKTAEELLELLNKIERGYSVYRDYSRKKRELWDQILEMDREELQSLFDSSARFYLVIDEINRGDISRIFGELITLLESDKRLGEENQLVVTLPYSKELFCIPPNLFILATMNTADRSIALIDVALRRRFGFIEMLPSYIVLLRELGLGDFETEENAVREINGWGDVTGDGAEDVKKLAVKALYAVNRRIIRIYDRDHQIGHSYLLRLKSAENVEKTLREIWYHEIIPLLQEYFYDSPDKLEEVLKSFVKPDENGFEIVNSDFLQNLREVARVD